MPMVSWKGVEKGVSVRGVLGFHPTLRGRRTKAPRNRLGFRKSRPRLRVNGRRTISLVNDSAERNWDDGDETRHVHTLSPLLSLSLL